MGISRRSFLKLIAASAAIAASPAFSSQRLPYVDINSGVVSYIGVKGKGFIGAKIVIKVHDFDGVGYPVEVNYSMSRNLSETYYDFDLSDIQKDVPDKFWWNKENCDKYPNVHTYVREQRFGESVFEDIEKMQNDRPLPRGWDGYVKAYNFDKDVKC